MFACINFEYDIMLQNALFYNALKSCLDSMDAPSLFSHEG